MPRSERKSIRFRGRDEDVLQTFRVRGRTYFALEQLSAAVRFESSIKHAAPGGDYRALYSLPRGRNHPP